MTLSNFIDFAGSWLGLTPWLLVAVVVAIPFERLFPRINPARRHTRRAAAIAGLTAIGIAVNQVWAWWLQMPFVEALVPWKVFSIAKLPIADLSLIILTMLLLDFLYFLTHLASHHIHWLWRLHRIHHADYHVTAFSSLLHHPLETLVLGAVVLTVVVLFGVPVRIYLDFGLVLALHAAFSHANIALPSWLDRWLRLIIVTPDVHRTHHSQDMREGNSNFGAMFTLWDRLFGTYTDRPRQPVDALSMGLPEGGRPRAFSLKELMLFPFR